MQASPLSSEDSLVLQYEIKANWWVTDQHFGLHLKGHVLSKKGYPIKIRKWLHKHLLTQVKKCLLNTFWHRLLCPSVHSDLMVSMVASHFCSLGLIVLLLPSPVWRLVVVHLYSIGSVGMCWWICPEMGGNPGCTPPYPPQKKVPRDPLLDKHYKKCTTRRLSNS